MIDFEQEMSVTYFMPFIRRAGLSGGCKVAEESGICDMNKLVIAYGDYMDRVRVLYKAEEKEKTGD